MCVYGDDFAHGQSYRSRMVFNKLPVDFYLMSVTLMAELLDEMLVLHCRDAPFQKFFYDVRLVVAQTLHASCLRV